MVSNACVLDSIRIADLPALARLFSDRQVRSFLGGPLKPQWADQRASELAQPSDQVWAIRERTGSAALLGIVVLDRHHELEDLEVSYLLLPEYWGQGHASAAVRQVMVHAFGSLGLRRLVAETQSANAASVRLLERLGFQLLCTAVRFGAEQSIYSVGPADVQAANKAFRPGQALQAVPL
ncbi:GNAT family N-acetyltransferase [Roseateles sp.]|uniref:GNAT family N-acetyltransferase n=1 Tax=Roseateles sp. TaxID=1971397 RepID=UPI003BA66445